MSLTKPLTKSSENFLASFKNSYYLFLYHASQWSFILLNGQSKLNSLFTRTFKKILCIESLNPVQAKIYSILLPEIIFRGYRNVTLV